MSGWVLALTFLMTALIIISRRPDALIHPQFWAEDGVVWYADAYNAGVWRPLLWPQNGYFQTAPRLAAAIAMCFPLRWAPLSMNLVAIAIQALAPMYLLSSRFRAIGGLYTRLLLSAVLVALPTTVEVHANITNSQWHLALLAFLVVVAQPPTSIGWRIFDLAVLTLSVLTGPFCILFVPFAVDVWWLRRQQWSLVLMALAAAAALLQATALLLTAAHTRSTAPLGATLALFFRLVGENVVLAPLLRPGFLPKHAAFSAWACPAATFAAVVLLVYILKRAMVELRLFALFGSVLVAAALLQAQTGMDQPRWVVLAAAGPGVRYWFIPTFAFLVCTSFLIGRGRPLALRVLGVVVIVAALASSARHWRFPRFTDFDFPRQAEAFERTPSGQELSIPINPPGWKLVLRKH